MMDEPNEENSCSRRRVPFKVAWLLVGMQFGLLVIVPFFFNQLGLWGIAMTYTVSDGIHHHSFVITYLASLCAFLLFPYSIVVGLILSQMPSIGSEGVLLICTLSALLYFAMSWHVFFYVTRFIIEVLDA
jgi:hypothetical protein